MFQRLLVVVCILCSIQMIWVNCDQNLGNLVASMNLNTYVSRDRLASGGVVKGIYNPASSFQIWVQGISTSSFQYVTDAIDDAGCSLRSSNINNQFLGLPNWGYVVARVQCDNAFQWIDLVFNEDFYSRVAFTERSYFTDNFVSNIEPVGRNDHGDNDKKRTIVKHKAPSDEAINEMKRNIEYMEENKKNWISENIDSMTEEQKMESVLKNKQRYQCVRDSVQLRLDGISEEEIAKRRAPCDPIGAPTPSPSSPFTPASPPTAPPTFPPHCVPSSRSEGEQETEEEKRTITDCPPLGHPIYILGLEQTYNNQLTSNEDWEQYHGRPWTNYLENIGWNWNIEQDYISLGGNIYSFDSGVYESHIELIDPNTLLTRVNRLPNKLAPAGHELDGFIDPITLGGSDPWIEDDGNHGTTNAVLTVGSILGVAKPISFWYAKIIVGQLVDMHGLQNALASVNQLVISGVHSRPAVVAVPILQQWYQSSCVIDPQSQNPPEPICTQGWMDELGIAYDNGIIVNIASGNGFDQKSLDIDPNTGLEVTNEILYPTVPFCSGRDYISPVPADLCDSARREDDLNFNIWDLYLPVYVKTTQRPFIVAAHNHNNHISSWRNIQYSLNDFNWTDPWIQAGSANVGDCVDFSAFGVDISRTAAIPFVTEFAHTFETFYRESPYTISGTSFSTYVAAAIVLHTMEKLPASSYGLQNNGNYVELIRDFMKQSAVYVTDDIDTCRINHWNDLSNLNSYPRVQFGWY